MTFYAFVRAIVYFPFHWLYRIRVEGIENVPMDRGFILCCNHRSNLDPFFIGVVLKQQLRFMAKIELFRIPLVNWFVRKVGAFPVNRGTGDTSAIDTAVQLVKDGQVLVIFPEGTRSLDGKLLRIKSGAMVVASKTESDVLPAVIKCKGRVRIFKRVTLRFGEIIKNVDIGIKDGSVKDIRNANELISRTFASLLES